VRSDTELLVRLRRHFDAKHSLHRKVTDAKAFYGAYTAQVVLAAAIVLIPNAPLGTMTQYVQVLAGVLAGLVVRRRRVAAGLAADALADVRHLDRDTWRMPRLEQLSAPTPSRFRMLCLYTLRGYLIISVVLITFKIASSVWG
jgi:hypothetical protein